MLTADSALAHGGSELLEECFKKARFGIYGLKLASDGFNSIKKTFLRIKTVKV